MSPDIQSPQPESTKEENTASESARPPVVEFRNVTKIWNLGRKNEFKALDDISFCVEDLPQKGEFISIIGPSGCGKSTALNLIAGFQEFYPPTSGEVLVRGIPVVGPGRDRGMVFQKYSSFPHLTVRRNVRFGFDLNRSETNLSNREIDELAMHWIEKVGLSGHENKYPHQLSGGQQQRVAIARTLILKPRILLMDEAFSALDEPTRFEMQLLLVDLWVEVEATVFLITHSIAEAAYLGDRVWVFSKAPGRIVKEFNNIPKAPNAIAASEVQRSPEFLSLVEEMTEVFNKIKKGEPL